MNDTAIVQVLDELGIDTSAKFVFVENPIFSDPDDDGNIVILIGNEETGEVELAEEFPFSTPEKVILEVMRERLQERF